MDTHRFYKDGRSWYIDLPAYLEQGGNRGDLQMVDGADTMLEIMARGGEEVTVLISRDPFEGSDELILTEKCDSFVGGGYYLLKEYEGQIINQQMWLCAVTEFVFGDLPNRIYVKMVNG
jgi:hypothetical protein